MARAFVRNHFKRKSDHYFFTSLSFMQAPRMQPFPYDHQTRPRQEAAFAVLSGGSPYIPASAIPKLLSKHVRDIRLTRREWQHLLLASQLKPDKELSKYDFLQLLNNRAMTRNGAAVRASLFRAADVIALNGPRNEPVTQNYSSRYSCMPPPIFILTVTIAQISLFVYFCLRDGIEPSWALGSACPGCDSPLIFDPTRRYEVWRYFTEVFLHAGLGHIVLNMVAQLVLGVPLEMVHKPWRIAPLYVAGALSGSMLQYALDPTVKLVGASGADYALLAAHVSNMVINWSQMPYRWYRLFAVFAFVAVDVGTTVYNHYHHCVPDISHLGHIGGSITGLLLGIAVLRVLQSQRWVKYLKAFCAIGFIAYAIALVILNVMIQPLSTPVWQAPCPSKS